jgi:hypothetical protein
MHGTGTRNAGLYIAAHTTPQPNTRVPVGDAAQIMCRLERVLYAQPVPVVARVLLQRPLLLLFADQAPAPHADDILRPGGMPRAAQSVTQLSINRGVCVSWGWGL